MPGSTFTDGESLVNECLALDYFTPDNKGVTPIPAYYLPGKDPLILVVGENASGKSFFRRIVRLICRDAKTECISISMEARQTISDNPWLSLVYGDEEHDSTGYNSASMVTTGIRTCQSREAKHVIFWDEPDVGLSENGAAGVGIAIRDFMKDPPKHTVAAIVVTHSKPLVQAFADLDPHYLHLGGGKVPQTLNDWLKTPVVARHPDDILKAGRKRFKLIQAILDDIKKEKPHAK